MNFSSISAVCDDYTTHLPDLPGSRPKDAGNYQGVGRHVYGSNPITSPNGQGQGNYNSYQNRQRSRGYEDNHQYGVLVPFPRTTPKPSKNSQQPPTAIGLPIVRNVNGRGPPPHAATLPHDMWPIRHGIRGELDLHHGHDNVFVPPSLFDPEDDLTNDYRPGSSNNENPVIEPVCNKKCDETTEFLCSKSCICISRELYCDGHIDCGKNAEDEEDCTMTEEMIKKLKEECEADIEPKHVMCPNSHICIKQEWLCDGGDCLIDLLSSF